jgi:mRNA-degrading endonuclease RelE of RelBE toxin-antitoxin system
MLRSPQRQLVRFWLVAAFLTGLLALGDATPLARIMYAVPGYNWFRCPARHFVETTLALATLAGLGIAAMTGGSARLWRWAAAAVLATARLRLQRICAARTVDPMVFVELTPFVAFRDEYWTDEDLRALQSFLLVLPQAGDLIRGGAGLRKVRWSAQGRGKRGGARVIYYWHVSKRHIYLIYGYVKSKREDLTPQQVKVLAELMKDVNDG